MPDNLHGLIVLPRLQVQNANAISGPLSWGYPSPTAFTGLVHALHRKLGTNELPVDDLDIKDGLALNGVGVVSHRFSPMVNRAGYRYRFNLTKNPVGDKRKIKNGKLEGASFVEEGRAHLELSLLIGVHGFLDMEDGNTLTRRAAVAIQSMRIAGGNLVPHPEGNSLAALYFPLSGNREDDLDSFRTLRRKLLPGFALLQRHQVLIEHLDEIRQQTPEATSLDALLDLVQLKNEPSFEGDEESGNVEWKSRRAKPGWLVPLPVGYAAISQLYEPGVVKNARDNTVPFRFVESIYSLGEWLSPHRIERAQDLLWYNRYIPESGMYLCEQPVSNKTAEEAR